MGRRTKAKNLRRSVASRPEKRTILIFCEGKRSEPDYLGGTRSLPGVRTNTALQIEIDASHGVPMVLVERAIGRLDPEVDEVWCVFDVESPQNHPHLDRALALADSHGIRVAVSNPCFEIWLIMHVEDVTRSLSTKEAERRRNQIDGKAGKEVDAAAYLPRRHEATARAAALARRHLTNGATFPDDNPSSGVGALLASIEARPG